MFNRKQRFYVYTRRLPSDLQEIDRDVFNEKPSKEDIIAVSEGQGTSFICDTSAFVVSPNELSLLSLFFRHTEVVQQRYHTYIAWRHSLEIIRYRMPKNGRKLLCAQQKWLL